MKKGTKNLLIVGAVGLGAYFFVVKPALDTANKIAAPLEAGSAALGGAVGFASDALGTFINPLPSIFNAATQLISGLTNGLGSLVPQADSRPIAVNQTPLIASSFNNSSYSPANVTRSLTQNTAQAAASSAFGVSAPASVNYLDSVGRGTPAATFKNQSGTYQASTGTFTNTSGQGFSVASYLVKPAATYAPATKPATYVNPLAVTANKYFKV